MKNNVEIGVCNCCGKEFNEDEMLEINHAFNYDSKFDGDTISLKLCSDCLDVLVMMLVTVCKVSPVVEGYCGYDEDLELVEN